MEHIQPLMLSELFTDTTHYTHMDAILPMLVSEYTSTAPLLLPVIPTGSCMLLFCYNTSNSRHAFITIGTQKQYMEYTPDCYEHYLCFSLQPGVLYSSTALLPAAVHNQIFIESGELPELLSICQNAANFTDKINACAAYFEHTLQAPHIPPTVFHLLNRIEEENGDITISALASELGYSLRHITRLFTQYFGFNAKDYCRCVRFQRALAEMIKEPDRNNSEFIQNLGYSDQAHFQRDFKFFTNLTPRQYTQQLRRIY